MKEEYEIEDTKKERGKWKGGNAIKTATDMKSTISKRISKNGVSRNMNGEYS